MMSSVNDGERDILLDRILTNLDTFHKAKNQLKNDIKECFLIDLTHANGAYFNETRKKSVLHFMVRKLLRFNLDCEESCRKYYGDELSTQYKLEQLKKAASSFPVFDERPPDIPSRSHPSFNELTTDGKRALRLCSDLEALRKSVNQTKIKKLAEVPSSPDKVICNSSSSSDQLSTVLGKRSSSPMESLINAAVSLEENKDKTLDTSVKENGNRNLREELDVTESVEMTRGFTNVC